MRQARADQDVAAIPEAQAIARGYIEAAGGDGMLAAQWLAQDLLAAEGERDRLLRDVSAGYLRRRIAAGARRG